MILAWFTEPLTSFSSYYQYETVTGRLVQIRLELGREGGSPDADTAVAYFPARLLGIATERYPAPDAGWGVDDATGRLTYQGAVLAADRPSTGGWVYDSGGPGLDVRCGDVVTDSPRLPTGIRAEYLVLLANSALLTAPSVPTTLTTSDATEPRLVVAILTRLGQILGGSDVNLMSAEDILGELRSQAAAISGGAADETVARLNDALDAASQTAQQINDQLNSGTLTPDAEFSTAVEEMNTALTDVLTATGAETELLTVIQTAQQAVETAIQTAAAQRGAIQEQLVGVRDSLATARENASRVQEIETKYKPLNEAENLTNYERDIGLEPEVLG